MNKKFLKCLTLAIPVLLGCITACSAFAATSYGRSSEDVLPESVYDIDKNNVLLGFKDAFLNDPDSEIYKDNFKNCDTMEIPASVTSIDQDAFYKDLVTLIPSFITKLTFAEGSNCKTIDEISFAGSSLTSITFPSSLETISDSAFYNCSSLASIDLSNCVNLTSIGRSACSGCSSLFSVSFPGSLQSIGESAFYNCSALTSISFPKDNNGKYGLATNLGDNAQVVVEKDNDGNYKWIYTNSLVSCLACGDVIIPDGTTSIGFMAFAECSSLTSITLPTSLQTIEIGAFAGCLSINSISFPGTLQTISLNAFSGCSSLKEIVWNNLNSAPTIQTESFLNVADTGQVKSTGSYTSSELLSLLKEKGDLPSAWEIAKD